jgi:DnaJ C terminal domain
MHFDDKEGIGMAFQPSGDLRATVTITQAESMSGTTRTLNLPGGRQITITIPSGTYVGQEMRLPGQGMATRNGGPGGTLIVTIAIAPAEYFGNGTYGNNDPTDYIQAPPPPPISTNAPDYVASGSGNAYTNYRTTGQDAGNMYTHQATYRSHSGSQQPTPPGLPPTKGQQSKQQGISKGVIALLLAVIVVLIGGGIFLTFVEVIQPNQQHMQATATAQIQASRAAVTAQANANATAAALATATAHTVATTTALQAIYTQATNANPTLIDPLRGQDGNNWDVSTTNGQGNCTFSGNSYHATAHQSDYFYACFAATPKFSNFAYQVQMTIMQGDYGGIIFRADGATSKYYYLRIGKDGAYDLTASHDTSFTHDQLLKSGNAETIMKTGSNQTNMVAVVANGGNLYLYVNQKYLAQVNDNTYKSGQIGVFGGNFASKSADAAFSNAQVWTI